MSSEHAPHRKPDSDKLEAGQSDIDLTPAGRIAYLEEQVGELTLRNAQLEQELRERRQTDPLTGLPDRAWFEAELERRRSGNYPFAIGILDLKDFKRVNDRYGHLAGDAVLRRCGLLIQLSLRDEDFVARLGGDEFGIILDMRPRSDSELSPEERAAATTVQIRQRVVGYAGGKFDISIGIAPHRSGQEAAETWRLADRRMYEHKRQQAGASTD